MCQIIIRWKTVGYLMKESSNDAGARGGQFETLDSEWIIIIRRIVDQETVKDTLLRAFRSVAGRDQRTSRSNGHVTLLDAYVLVESVAVRLDFVDDDSPFALYVDGAQRLHVGCSARTKVSFLDQFVQSIDRVLRIDGDVFVQL